MQRGNDSKIAWRIDFGYGWTGSVAEGYGTRNHECGNPEQEEEPSYRDEAEIEEVAGHR